MAALSLRPPSPSSSSPPPPSPSSSSLPPSPWPWLPSNATSPSPPPSPIPTDDLTNDEDAADDDHDHDHLKDNESPQRSTSIPAASEPPLPEPPLPALLGLSFNQDRGCFAAATGRGFRIYNCDPFREIFRRDLGEGGVALVEMLFRCNILALVGGGPHPRYPATKVMIWDDNQGACIGELSFRSEVRAVRLRRDRVVVVLDRSVFVYGLANLRLFHQIETVLNPRGLCVVSQQQGPMVLACPGGHKGQVRVEHYGARRARFIVAHDSRIACLALSQDGAFVATASTKGTLVRVFSSVDGTLLQEVRRGADRAEIHSLAFSADMQWLAVSSDKGTVHVFGLKVTSGPTGADKPQAAPEPIPPSPPISSLSFMKGVLPKYFHSEWSVAQFRLHEGSRYIVAFGHKKNTIIILGMDGSFYRCEFDPVHGGEMTQLECHHFLKPGETL